MSSLLVPTTGSNRPAVAIKRAACTFEIQTLNPNMTDFVPPSSTSLREALSLSEDILRNIELNEQPLANIALKTGRLARLLNDLETRKIMGFEAGGYPFSPAGVPQDVYELAVQAGRETQEKKDKGEISKSIYTSSIAELEQMAHGAEIEFEAARDPNVSISSANPNQFVMGANNNFLERQAIRNRTTQAVRRLAKRRAFIHDYALRKNSELKYSGIADDIFSRLRERVDNSIGKHVPDAVQQFVAVYDNLASGNKEDWSNAVHSCRRILQNLADVIFPAQSDIQKVVNGKSISIKLGADNYINRIVAFIESKSGSGRFDAIVGSHLRFVGERLDSVFEAAQKGSHATVEKEEADRYVVYTYLIVGDVLSLLT